MTAPGAAETAFRGATEKELTLDEIKKGIIGSASNCKSKLIQKV